MLQCAEAVALQCLEQGPERGARDAGQRYGGWGCQGVKQAVKLGVDHGYGYVQGDD